MDGIPWLTLQLRVSQGASTCGGRAKGRVCSRLRGVVARYARCRRGKGPVRESGVRVLGTFGEANDAGLDANGARILSRGISGTTGLQS